jgi:hypothetical protein
MGKEGNEEIEHQFLLLLSIDTGSTHTLIQSINDDKPSGRSETFELQAWFNNQLLQLNGQGFGENRRVYHHRLVNERPQAWYVDRHLGCQGDDEFGGLAPLCGCSREEKTSCQSIFPILVAYGLSNRCFAHPSWAV